MPEAHVNGIRLYYEEHGEGAPIACIHGVGSSALMWADSVEELARLGRVISYDRRGFARSERPDPYERTNVSEQADDAAGLVDALAAVPAVVIGRSYGGWVATDLALRHPDRVRALALLEPDAPGLSPTTDQWISAFSERMRQVAAEAGVDAVGEALIGEVAGEDAWRLWPDEFRGALAQSGPAILADLRSYEGAHVDIAALATIDRPVLLLAAVDSPPEFREVTELLADTLPNARLSRIAGGHLIDPAAPEVLAFIEEVLDSG